MNERTTVIEFGKQSYVLNEAYSYNKDTLIVNGSREWPKAPGDPNFVVVEGKVKTIARYVGPSKVAVKYALRPDLLCASKAAWTTPTEYAVMREHDQALYTPVMEERENTAVPVEWDVVDGLAAPRKMPQGIVPKAPGHIRVHSWFWWTQPCVATSDFVFNRLAERAKALDPCRFAVTIYANIQHLRIEVHTLTVGGVTFKPDKALLWVGKDRGEGPAIGFEGKNLDDAIRQADAWCDDKMKAVASVIAMTVCPCCARKLPKEIKPMTRARDPKYRKDAHDIS